MLRIEHRVVPGCTRIGECFPCRWHLRLPFLTFLCSLKPCSLALTKVPMCLTADTSLGFQKHYWFSSYLSRSLLLRLFFLNQYLYYWCLPGFHSPPSSLSTLPRQSHLLTRFLVPLRNGWSHSWTPDLYTPAPTFIWVSALNVPKTEIITSPCSLILRCFLFYWIIPSPIHARNQDIY